LKTAGRNFCVAQVVYLAQWQYAKSVRTPESVRETPTTWIPCDVALLGDERLHDSRRDTYGVFF